MSRTPIFYGCCALTVYADWADCGSVVRATWDDDEDDDAQLTPFQTCQVRGDPHGILDAWAQSAGGGEPCTEQDDWETEGEDALICDRCDHDTEVDQQRAYEDGGPERCSRCGLTLPEPSADWLRSNGYEIGGAE